MHSPIRALLGLSLTLTGLLVGCLDGTTRPCITSIAQAVPTTAEREVTTGVVQRVAVSNVAPCLGEDIQIHSELEVTATQPVALAARICGLDLDGDLDLRWPPEIGTCGGSSVSGTFVPGSLLQSGMVQRVHSRSGSYTLRIRHSLEPSLWLSIPVVVRSR